MLKRLVLLALFPSLAMAQDKREPNDPIGAMRRLRLRMLSTPAAEFGITSTDQCRHVFGVVMDWPVDDNIVSVIAMCDGNASLYTTSSFGVIGGGKHSTVRRAATDLVRDANRFYSAAKPTSDRSYPNASRVRFYLLTFDGLKMLEDQRSSVERGRSQYSPLFDRGQEVVTRLREVADKRE